MSVCEANLPLNNSPFLFQLIDPARLALVDRFYRSHGYKVKCAASERVFALADSTGDFIAAARLVPQASGHYWLRNLLVSPQWRGRGLASGLMMDCKPHLAPLGCYCFALPHLTEFYRRLGFDINPVHCPADILANYQKYRSRGRDWVLMGYKQD
ncbi:GNAT family N-acetyltransferase [Cellvibrio mixtus]|uniref:GNAT family N-acetyltransferase n=1 Tax=Cellvibrio mixtus TaxID=39650 RepID=UPI000587CD8F|nr:GNAT family N-acetyltransferase [Cellvibrio mixtus]